MKPHRKLFVILSPAALYAGIILGMHGFHSGWVALLAYHAGICISLTLAKAWPSRRRAGSRLNLPVTRALVVAGLAAGPLIIILWRFMELPGTSMGQALAGVGLQGWSWMGFALYYAAVNPWLEEIFWRDSYSRLAPGWLSDILFSGYHLFVMVLLVRAAWLPVAFVVLCAISAAWRVSVKRSGRLATSVFSHLAADISIVSAAAWLLR
jgi:hypothetical protein